MEIDRSKNPIGFIMENKFKDIKKLSNLLKCIVSAALIIFLLRMLDISMIRELSYDAFFLILSSVAILLFFIWMLAYRWKMVLESFGYSTSHKQLYIYYLNAMFYNIFLPGIGGDISRATNSNSKYHLGMKKAAFIVVVERVTGIMGLFTILSIGGFFLYRSNYLYWIGLLTVVVLNCLLFIAHYLREKLSAIHVNWLLLGKSVLMSAVAQSHDIFICLMLCKYFSIDINIFQIMVITPLVYMATFIPISIGGIGVREGALVGLLTFYGAENSTAVFISFLMYINKIGVAIPGFFIYLRTKPKSTELS